MFVVDYFVLEIWLRAKDIDGYTIPSFWTFGLLKLLLEFKPGAFNQSKDILKVKKPEGVQTGKEGWNRSSVGLEQDELNSVK